MTTNWLDAALGAAERQAKTVLAGVRALRRQAASGTVAGLPRRLEQLPAAAEPLAEALRMASGSFSYDAEAAFAGGADGRNCRRRRRPGASCWSSATAASPRSRCCSGSNPRCPRCASAAGWSASIRLGLSASTAHLKKAQDSSAFNAESFLETLFRAATHLARADARADQPRPGAVVPLLDIYELLTLLPAAAADYPREAFASDLLRLNRAPDTKTRAGWGFALPASTGSKGQDRLTVYDERGAEHVFVGIRFLAPART